MDAPLFWILAIAITYLVGSIPFGLLLGKARGVDIRHHGSGNIGATNLLRTCGRAVGIAGFTLDVLKGLLPVAVVGLVAGLVSFPPPDATAATNAAWLAVGAATILGHIFPVYLGFRGGKGVATGLGMLLGFFPWTTAPAVAAFAVWAITLNRTRFVSVASIAAASALPVLTIAQLMLADRRTDADLLAQCWVFPAGTAVIAALVIAKHRTNIARLRAGTEASIDDHKGAERREHDPTAG
jgi:glycerol-3-phosphate acyltransferase PlsY